MVQDAEVIGNRAARGLVAKQVLGVDPTCDRASIRAGDNRWSDPTRSHSDDDGGAAVTARHFNLYEEAKEMREALEP